MRARCSITRGSLLVSTPSPSIQEAIVNRYGSQIVYWSPMTHRPFKNLCSISAKHSVMVDGTLRFIASIAAVRPAGPSPTMRVRNVYSRAKIGVELLNLGKGERIGEGRELGVRETLRYKAQQRRSFSQRAIVGHQCRNAPFRVEREVFGTPLALRGEIDQNRLI